MSIRDLNVYDNKQHNNQPTVPQKVEKIERPMVSIGMLTVPK